MPDGKNTMPSYVNYNNDAIVAGSTAKNATGKKVKPECVIFDAKRLIG